MESLRLGILLEIRLISVAGSIYIGELGLIIMLLNGMLFITGTTLNTAYGISWSIILSSMRVIEGKIFMILIQVVAMKAWLSLRAPSGPKQDHSSVGHIRAIFRG